MYAVPKSSIVSYSWLAINLLKISQKLSLTHIVLCIDKMGYIKTPNMADMQVMNTGLTVLLVVQRA